jgi:hypothetical protein
MPQATPKQVLTADGLSALSRGVEASTVPEADRSGTQDVPSADKQNDKRSGMDPELATVLKLPEAIRSAILTFVRASVGRE